MSDILHPGGLEITQWMLEKAGIVKGQNGKALDLGAGSGKTLELLQEYGYEVKGIDLDPKSDTVEKGDFTQLDSLKETYDLVISECSLYLSAKQKEVLENVKDILKPNGILLVSDVFQETEEELNNFLIENGFNVLFLRDISDEWKEYIIESMWEGTWQYNCDLNEKGIHYYLLGAQKEKSL